MWWSPGAVIIAGALFRSWRLFILVSRAHPMAQKSTIVEAKCLRCNETGVKSINNLSYCKSRISRSLQHFGDLKGKSTCLKFSYFSHTECGQHCESRFPAIVPLIRVTLTRMSFELKFSVFRKLAFNLVQFYWSSLSVSLFFGCFFFLARCTSYN